MIAIKRICPTCGKIVDSSTHKCPNKPKYNKVSKLPARWRKVRSEVKQRDMCCLMCWDRGVLTTTNLEAHHIKWREYDDSEENLYNIDNIITLCSDFHHEIHSYKMNEKYEYLQCLLGIRQDKK